MNRTEAATWNLKNGHGMIVAMPGVVIVLRGIGPTYRNGHSISRYESALNEAVLFGRCARPHDRKALESAIRYAWPDGDT